MSIRFPTTNSGAHIACGNVSLPPGDWALFYGINAGTLNSAQGQCHISIGDASDTIQGNASHLTIGTSKPTVSQAWERDQLCVTGRDSANLSFGTRNLPKYMGLGSTRPCLSGFFMPNAGNMLVVVQKSGAEIQLWQVRKNETAVLFHTCLAMSAWAGFQDKPMFIGVLNRAVPACRLQAGANIQRVGKVAKALTAAQMEALMSGVDPVDLLGMNAPDGDLYWAFDDTVAAVQNSQYPDAIQGQVATVVGSGWQAPTQVIPLAPAAHDIRLLQREVYHGKTNPAMIRLDGTYRAEGSIIDVQARVLYFSTQDVALEWTTIAQNVSGGSWSGFVASLARALLDYEFQIRLVIDGVPQTPQTGYRGQVGIILHIMGQSLAEYMRTNGAYQAGVSANVLNFLASTCPPASGSSNYLGAPQANWRRGTALAYQYQIGYGEYQLARLISLVAACKVLTSCPAQNGSSIISWTNDVSRLFSRTVETVQRLGGGIMIWQQGHADQSGDYYPKLETFYQQLVSALGLDTFDFSVSPMALHLATTGTNSVYNNRIRQKIWTVEKVEAGVPNVFLADNNTNDIALQDFIHESPNIDGAGRMVERWAQSILKWVGVTQYSGEGPKITQVLWDGALKLTIQVQHNGGSDLKTPLAGAPTGFEVSVNGGTSWVPPESVAIASPSTLELILAAVPADLPLVRYQYGGPGPTPLASMGNAERRTNAGIDNPVYDDRVPGLNSTLGFPLGYTVAPLVAIPEGAIGSCGKT